MKMAAGCTDCGYDDHPVALDFDHLPGAEKAAAIATLIRQCVSWERLVAEMEKCEVVCANCHRVRTAERHKEMV